MNENDWAAAFSSLPAWMRGEASHFSATHHLGEIHSDDGVVPLVEQGPLVGVPLWFVDTHEIDEVHT